MNTMNNVSYNIQIVRNIPASTHSNTTTTATSTTLTLLTLE